jgi:hypothetical protein
MDSREILNFGEGHYEVWDYWGNRLFEAETLEGGTLISDPLYAEVYSELLVDNKSQPCYNT